MSNLIRHPYHLVDESPWPILASFTALLLTLNLTNWFHQIASTPSIKFTRPILNRLLCVLLLIIVSFQWWLDVASEASLQGLHTTFVELGMRWGMALFIVSEIFFFLSFFWAFFHSRLAPNPELGRSWPPLGILTFNAFEVPLLNTLILLRSGVTVTWAHHALISGDHKETLSGLIITILLGIYFTALQALEYYEASFSFADRIYGSTFFIATGFHGLHVIVGTLFLRICLIRTFKYHFTPEHHFGFEAAAWYWHFVDIVWLFLFISIYWWGGI